MTSTSLTRSGLKPLIRKAVIGMMVVGCTGGPVRLAGAADPAPPEYQVKAAFLYQFVKFVEWPSQAFRSGHNQVVIGVLGEGPMGRALAAVQGKTAKGRVVAVERYKTVAELDYCHVLFISSSMDDQLPAILKRMKGWSALTVGDVEGSARRGVMINFITVEDTIRFEVNMEAAKRANLRIGSELLGLAQAVHGVP
ncbi:MAG: YfiR family protein [Candidatus Methylomirabilis sp.]|nr:YfiR family protein [Candidatus Methylomirabilis sp.]